MKSRLLFCVLLAVLFAEILPKLDAQDVVAGGKRDIVFLVDSTMGSVSIVSLRAFIRHFVDTWTIGPEAVQVGIAQFSTAPSLKMDLNTHGTKEALTAALREISPAPGRTVNIGVALDFVRLNMLLPEKGSRIQQGVPQLILLVASKKSVDSVEEPATALKQMGVLTLAAGSGTADEQELKQIVLADQLVFMAQNFRTLFRKPREIVSALSTLAGVVLTEAPTEPVETTSQKPKVIQDIVFLLDGSDYIGSTNLPFVRDFLINTVSQLDVHPDGVQVGLLQFAEHPKVEFYLNSFNNKQDVVNRTCELRLTGGSVLNTGAALDHALFNMFLPAAGSRRGRGVQQVLVLITGGPAQDQVEVLADKLALAGVVTVTVGAGQADETQLKSVAFVPQLVFHRTNFSDLPALAQLVVPQLTKEVQLQQPDEGSEF